MLNPYEIFVLMAIEIMTFAKINLLGAQHYRHHSRISLQSSNGNAIAQTPQRRDNLSAIAKRVKHLRTEIFCEEFKNCGANALPLHKNCLQIFDF